MRDEVNVPVICYLQMSNTEIKTRGTARVNVTALV